MKRKQIPLVLMLIAGAVTSLTVYFRDLGLKTMLIALLASMLTFYFIGSVIKMVFDSLEAKENAEVSDEGEVIEKESDDELQAASEGVEQETEGSEQE